MKNHRSTFLRTGALITLQLTLFLMLVFSLLIITSSAFAQSNDAKATATPEYSTYTVRPGDGWGIIAQRLGTTVTELKRLNPQAVRYGDILRVNEQLQVPFQTPVAIATEYIVQPGDGWGIIAQRYGIFMRDLMDANPDYVRYGLVLRPGDRLLIPAVGGAVAIATKNAGDSTTGNTAANNSESANNSADQAQAAETPVPADAATEAPTEIPADTPTEVPSDTPTEIPTETATELPTETATEVATEAAAPTDEPAEEPAAAAQPATDSADVASSDVQSDTAAAGQEATTGETNNAAAQPVVGCPVDFADYPALIVAKADESDGLTGLQNYLTECGVLRPESFLSQDWTGDGTPDLAVVYDNVVMSGTITTTELLILDSSSAGYQIGYQARPAGAAQLLASFDLNSDSQPDVVWSDTNCGTKTCFVTVNVQSWDGNRWQKWTAANITLPDATVSLEDNSTEGQGLEIVLDGGIYDNVGAGPQRGRVETWGSVNGEPYTKLNTLYNASPCLYHAVLDANEAYANVVDNDYSQAEALYTKAYSDTTLKPCWTRFDEEKELRSFSLFRLALIAANNGQTEEAGLLVQNMNVDFADSPVTGAANEWLATLTETGNLEGACAKVNDYAAENPQVVEILADYGYANPTFSASDFCPLPKTEPEEPAAQDKSSEILESAVVTDTEAVTTSEEITASEEISTSEESTTAISDTTSSQSTTVASGAQEAVENTECPKDLKGFSDALPAVLTLADGDTQTVLDYLTQCEAATDNDGDVAVGDFDDDGFEDAIVMPSIRSDLGFGPEGAQGAVLIYHGSQAGDYKLVYNPEIYGGTQLLASEDLNGDGNIDLAWTVTGCTTSCLTETQMVSWNSTGAIYESIIRPGALIAEGSVELAPVPPADPGSGRQLVMTGGVSTLPDSGLAVPHSEIWESVGGTPFQRIHWTYDRKAEGNDCFGLRLVEAEMAMRAANVLTYTTAIKLYQEAVDDSTLKTCSIHGLAEDTERALLQGLGRFRLVQASALSGDSEGAEVALATMNQSAANEAYKQIAADWLESYKSTGQADTACATVQPLIETNEELWQITDHFGFNHSVVGKDRICFVPETAG